MRLFSHPKRIMLHCLSFNRFQSGFVKRKSLCKRKRLTAPDTLFLRFQSFIFYFHAGKTVGFIDNNKKETGLPFGHASYIYIWLNRLIWQRLNFAINIVEHNNHISFVPFRSCISFCIQLKRSPFVSVFILKRPLLQKYISNPTKQINNVTESRAVMVCWLQFKRKLNSIKSMFLFD